MSLSLRLVVKPASRAGPGSAAPASAGAGRATSGSAAPASAGAGSATLGSAVPASAGAGSATLGDGAIPPRDETAAVGYGFTAERVGDPRAPNNRWAHCASDPPRLEITLRSGDVRTVTLATPYATKA